jgi:hypothetical protein
MKKAIIIVTALFLLATIINLTYGATVAPSKPSGKSSGRSGMGGMGGTAGDNPDEVKINWQAENITSTISIATNAKKVIFIYFYFEPTKEAFPPIMMLNYRNIPRKDIFLLKYGLRLIKTRRARCISSTLSRLHFSRKTNLYYLHLLP